MREEIGALFPSTNSTLFLRIRRRHKHGGTKSQVSHYATDQSSVLGMHAT